MITDMTTYLFAYGSLMNPLSLAKTLPGERTVCDTELRGYRRKMNAPFDGYAYLNIVPDKNSTVSGKLIAMSEAEMGLFSSREEGYLRTDVSENIDGAPHGRVFVFIAPDIECAMRVPQSYLDTCTYGMSDAEKQRWIDETEMSDIEEDRDNPIYDFAA
jgi:gamma-glutamylcyclotransferase (GGCT)/AIG2-like uncharacterized protein YtfP